MDIKLKQCPFCGSDNVSLVYTSDKTGKECCIDDEEQLRDKDIYAYIHCYECSIEMLPDPYDEPENVIESWNRRA